MNLDGNWRAIVRRAWSFRLMALAVVLSATEAVLPLFQDRFPPGLFAGLTALAVAGAMIARVVAQEGL